MKPKNPAELTAARLRELLSYDSATGIFRRLVSTSSNAKAGDVAGSLSNKGYLLIYVDGSRYLAHRLAWLYVHGAWPDDQLDHWNGIRSDNWIENLRKATNDQNQQNRVASRGSTSGHLGVCWHSSNKRWMAQIMIGKKTKYLGYFSSVEEASAAYAAAKAKLHPFQPIIRAVRGES